MYTPLETSTLTLTIPEPAKPGRGRPKTQATRAREAAAAAAEQKRQARGAARLARALTPSEQTEYDEFKRIDNRRERLQPLTKTQRARFVELAPKWEARRDAELSRRFLLPTATA